MRYTTRLPAGLLLLLGIGVVAAVRANNALASPADTVALSSLNVSRALQTWGRPRKDATVAGKQPLRISGRSFENGFGTHSFSRLFVHLGGQATRFTASVGLDEGEGGRGSAEFRISGDGKILWSSGVLRTSDATRPVSLDVSSVRYLTLEVTDGGDGLANDHADWANARFEVVSGPIKVVERLPEDRNKIVPGAAWRDTDGNLIQAHGGGILRHGGRYYWYGEDRTNGYVAIGVSAYVSDDLVNWKRLGVVLPHSAYSQKWQERTIAERPKVIYNPRTRQFVLWFHYDRSGYGDSQAGVAVGDRPEGPFQFLGMYRPVVASTYRDMNLFVDDDGARLRPVCRRGKLHAAHRPSERRLDRTGAADGRGQDLDSDADSRSSRGARAVQVPGQVLPDHLGRDRLEPEPAQYAVADQMLGDWKPIANPFVGAGSEITFGSQSTFVLPVPGKPAVSSTWATAGTRKTWPIHAMSGCRFK
jgi:hypothetical protein